MYGWLMAATTAVLYETYAVLRDKELMTQGMRRLLLDPVSGPVIVGVSTGLVYHFVEGIFWHRYGIVNDGT